MIKLIKISKKIEVERWNCHYCLELVIGDLAGKIHRCKPKHERPQHKETVSSIFKTSDTDFNHANIYPFPDEGLCLN